MLFQDSPIGRPGAPLRWVHGSLAALALSATAHAQHAVDVHIQALGGLDAIAAVKTMQRSGKAQMTGAMGDMEGKFEEISDIANGNGYSLLDVGVFVQDSGWVGEQGWQNNSFEGLKDMSTEDLGFAKLSAQPSMIAALRSQYGLAAFVEPEDREYRGKDCVLLRVVGSPLEWYVDKATQMLEGLLVPGILEITYGDYRVVDGVRLPFASTTDVILGGIVISNTYERTVLNGAIDPAKFTKPE